MKGNLRKTVLLPTGEYSGLTGIAKEEVHETAKGKFSYMHLPITIEFKGSPAEVDWSAHLGDNITDNSKLGKALLLAGVEVGADFDTAVLENRAVNVNVVKEVVTGKEGDTFEVNRASIVSFEGSPVEQSELGETAESEKPEAEKGSKK